MFLTSWYICKEPNRYKILQESLWHDVYLFRQVCSFCFKSEMPWWRSVESATSISVYIKFQSNMCYTMPSCCCWQLCLACRTALKSNCIYHQVISAHIVFASTNITLYNIWWPLAIISKYTGHLAAAPAIAAWNAWKCRDSSCCLTCLAVQHAGR